MLSSHPEIHVFGEFEEAVSRLGDTGWVDLSEYHAFLRLNRAAIAHGFLVDRSLSYPDLVRDFFGQARSRTTKPVVGAAIHSRFDRCPDLFPGANYLHVLRDPRDVAESCVAMGWAGNVYYGAETWVVAERRWDALCRRVPASNRHEVRYEDLVAQPEHVLRGVCRFVGVPFRREMLDYHQASSYGPPDPSGAQRWRQRSRPRDIQLVEHRCGPFLTQRGYEVSGLAPYQPARGGRLLLMADNRVRRAQASVRKYGAVFWTVERLARIAGIRRIQETIQLRRNELDAATLK